MKIILASHSKLAEGMSQTAQFFGLSEIAVIEQTMDDTGFETRARDLLNLYKNEDVVVFTDIVGGSVNQIFTRLLREYQFHLISGMNLPLILEIGFKNEIDLTTINEMIEQAKNQIVYMNDFINTILEDEED
ncbi:MAG: hypothetical protein Q4C64_05925 [Erysipelotrichia bacterium]|nr:hypothetical protein [Erysipelotrichia bacterium]